MKYIKYFENSVEQQPFFLRGDRLYISDELAKKTATLNKKQYLNPPTTEWIKYMTQMNYNFFNDIRSEKGFRRTYAITNFHVRYNDMYRMNIMIFKGTEHNNEFGHFQYYIGGNSGDHEMHGKNMIRATRECNLNFIIKLYPIVEHIKDFYKKLTNKEPFLYIIKEAIKKDNSIIKFGAPNELIDDKEIGYLIGSYKYNL